MTFKVLKLRLRRRFRRSQRQVEKLGNETGRQIERNIINRLGRLVRVRRFVAGWVFLLILLIVAVLLETGSLRAYYEDLHPLPGGIYTEGILGDFTNANPIYASNPVDSSVSRLIFAGLLTYDQNNNLTGCLASSWSVDKSGKVYTVKLKPHLTWQDGQPLTAADVAFTYQVIQNPDAGSPLYQSWQNVTVSAVDPTTVTFTLSDALASFPYSLTNGIVPQHLLGNVPMAQMRSAAFNTDPIGAGPFLWKNVAVQGDTPGTRQEQITLAPFSRYANGAPKLDGFIVRAYHDKTQLVSDFKTGLLNGVAGLSSVPSNLTHNKSVHTYSLPLTAANMVFFKTNSSVLADKNIRQALVKSINTKAILSGLSFPTAPVSEPFLDSQTGYNPLYAQLGYNLSSAEQELDSNGWKLHADGIRYKAGQPLSFNLFAGNDSQSAYVTKALSYQWSLAGVQANVRLQDDAQLQTTIATRAYDALFYGISIGVDPDVFVYWDSSQASPSSGSSVNFSAYNSSAASQALESGRTSTQPELRAIKYKPFLQAWQQDAPALGLYQPQFLYLTNETVYGLGNQTINQAADRFNNVQNWEIRSGLSTN